MRTSSHNSKHQRGFTIVELLIVIVVIAILAAISIVAYNGIQERARDSQREAAIATITKALEMYHIDNSGYPTCTGGTYTPGDVRASCYSDDTDLIAALTPKYISEFPQDPIGGGSRFLYIYGSRKTSDTVYAGDSSDNYILGVAFETRDGPTVGAWPSNPHNYLAGSSN